MLPQQQVINFLHAAMECTIYLSPKDPGLTNAELLEAGQQAGFKPGEINDAIFKITTQYIGGGDRKNLPSTMTVTWSVLAFPQSPEYRNFKALDLVMRELNDRTRDVGAAAAQIERDVLVARGVEAGIPVLDMEAAVTLLVLNEQLVEKNGTVRFKHGGVHEPLPSEQQKNMHHERHSEAREKAYSIVKDVIGRRSDGRAASAEPLSAFSDVLAQLGYQQFRLWWTQTASEFRRTDSQSSPLSSLVLSAALVEGALTFVVKHARTKQIGPFKSSDFAGDPKTWKIEDLVNSAATGQAGAIFDPNTKSRVLTLVKTRQRIHAGRMLSEYPSGIPDLRPEEARDAKATAEIAIRKLLDWIDANP